MGGNYVAYHVHTELSLLDSCTNHRLYTDRASELGQKAICFTEHGNIYGWVEKKMYCESRGLKYLHGMECYLTRTHGEKERDNFHTILIAKNYDGVREINGLIELSSREDHKYYSDRISFGEFFALSGNIIKISACLSSPLNGIAEDEPVFGELVGAYDYLEVQPHINSPEQIEYNKKLLRLSKEYGIPLIAGTDTHSISGYKAECREILLKAKRKSYNNENELDLTYKTYDELRDMFRLQDALPESEYMAALRNTEAMADSVDEFALDLSFKYPKVYTDEDTVLWDRIMRMYGEKLSKGIICDNPKYTESMRGEFEVLKKIGMCGFILFMSELMCWCWENSIPSSPCRGSVGGSVIAYITDITDVDPVVWGTVFSRFANEDRIEIGDIDVDFAPQDRERIYRYIIDRFGDGYTSYIMTTGTCAEKGTIDEICRALQIPLGKAEQIKTEYANNAEKAKSKYKDVFYYFDGLINTVISKGIHPAAVIISPAALSENYGVYHYEGKRVISINMEEVHEVSLVKYDILGLKNVGVIKTCCELAGIGYPKSHTVDWNNGGVWDNICRSNTGIFQFESAYAGECLKKFKPQKINDLSLINGALRPSGASYRERLLSKEINKNPSRVIDEMLADNYGYLCFQEDTIKFLKDICGLTGSEADNIRRAIGRKQKDRLDAAMPQILEGYCGKSPNERAAAEKEAKVFLQIIEDSSDYQFGYNHATGYSMLGYLCAYMRHYYPLEFCAALLINAKGEDDTVDGTMLAKELGITIKPVRFRYSKGGYTPDKPGATIYKGIGSVKYCNAQIGGELYALRDGKFDTFTDLLLILNELSIDSQQLDILVKLDYFSEFGNSKELLKIIEVFGLLKQGAAKHISKDKVTDSVISGIISRYGRATAKKYILADTAGCMRECEDYIKRLGMADFTVREKALTHLEYLGYVDIQSSHERDTNTLLVLDVQQLRTKDKSRVWAHKLKTVSLARGKQAELTVLGDKFSENPLTKFDAIKVEKKWLKKRTSGGYINWYLSNYEVLSEQSPV